MSDGLLLVSSAVCAEAASRMRAASVGIDVLRDCGVTVSPAQLETMARVLREAEPSVCNGSVAERPGFVAAERQGDDPEVVTFTVGILPSMEYLIERDGSVRSEGQEARAC